MYLIEKLIRKLKGDPKYNWEGSYSIRDMSIVVFDRGKQVMRGLWERIFLKECRGLLFIGRKVRIQHAHKIMVGKNFIVGDYSLLNGLSIDGIIIGENVTIGRNSTLTCTGVIAHVGQGIKIGDGTGINDGAFLAGQGGIQIGKNVIIGPGVKMFSENHKFDSLSEPIKLQGVNRSGIKIGDDCWIGANVVILDGVVIGDGCVIAAGAVVNKSLPNYSVAGGVPSKIIKYRNN